MVTISIIGVGRVGGAIALAVPAGKYSVNNLVYRNTTVDSTVIKSLSPDGKVVPFDEIDGISSDVVFITTRDAEIIPVSKALVGKLSPNSIVFHTCGALSSSALDALRTVGHRTGSIHPLVSVSNPALGPERFRGAYFCVEGHPAAVSIGQEIATDLGGYPFTIDTEFKTLYHASAVTACGHLVALFDAAVEMMTKCGLSAAASKKILLPLVKSTVQNLGEQSTSAALTGTFARADIDTFTRHLTALNQYVSDDLLEIYLLLGERSLELAAKQGVSADRIDRLRTKVSVAKSKLKW